MAGHNKWTQIKRKKEAVDAKKSQRFALLVKNLQLAVKQAGADLNSAAVRSAIDRARAANLPNENIDRVLKAVTADGDQLEKTLYEAYGPGGAALIIETATTSKNRTAQELKHLLAEHGATLAAPGAALWAFEKTALGWRPKQAREVPDGARVSLGVLLAALAAQGEVELVTNDVKL